MAESWTSYESPAASTSSGSTGQTSPPNSTGEQSSLAKLLPAPDPASYKLPGIPISYEIRTPQAALLARGFIEGINARDWEHPSFVHHIAPEFLAVNDATTAPTPFTQFLETYRKRTVDFPYFQMEVLNESVDVDEQSGKAKVWQFCRITGHPVGVNRETLGMSQWRRDVSGTWLCYKHRAYRSAAEFVAPSGS